MSTSTAHAALPEVQPAVSGRPVRDTPETSAEAQPGATGPRGPDGLDGIAASVWQRMRPRVATRLDTLVDAGRAAEDGSLGVVLHTEARAHAHRLAQVLSSYGFEEAAILAAAVEAILIDEDGIDAAGLLDAVARLRAALGL